MAFLPDVVAPFWRPFMAMGFDVTPACAQSRETGACLMEGSDGEFGFAAWLNCSGAKPEKQSAPGSGPASTLYSIKYRAGHRGEFWATR
jgi:hypothetical protein